MKPFTSFQELDALGEGRNGIYALAIARQVVVCHVHIEHIFPFVPDDGQRLYLGEIDVIERKDGENFRE